MVCIEGGAGNDLIYGNEGADFILGDNYTRPAGTHNTIYGGEGADFVCGGRGNDVLYGNEGDDNIDGEEGNDVLIGGRDKDYLWGGEGDDVLYGNTGNDWLMGESGNDAIYGDEDNDRLVGGTGIDSLYGGQGADIFIFNPFGYKSLIDLNSLSSDNSDAIAIGVRTDHIFDLNAAEGDKIVFIGIESQSIEIKNELSCKANTLQSLFASSEVKTMNQVQVVHVNDGALQGHDYLAYMMGGIREVIEIMGVIEITGYQGPITTDSFVNLDQVF